MNHYTLPENMRKLGPLYIQMNDIYNRLVDIYNDLPSMDDSDTRDLVYIMILMCHAVDRKLMDRYYQNKRKEIENEENEQ